MKFFNLHRKGIALLALLSFFYLLHVTTAPAYAAPRPEAAKNASAVESDTPGLIEQTGPVYKPGGKSSIVPIILAGIAVIAVVAVLVLVVFKTKYDITGTWTFSFVSVSPAHSWEWDIEFTGSKSSGNALETYNNLPGTYTVDGKKMTVKLDFEEFTDVITLTGNFDDKNNMSGNATIRADKVEIGEKAISVATWTATRTSGAPASIPGRIQKAKITKK